jgi:hypothetical protein
MCGLPGHAAAPNMQRRLFITASIAYFPYMITINRGSNVKGLYYNPFTGSTIFMYGLPGHAGAPNL